MGLIVVLYLTTWNATTGDLLSESRYEIGSPSVGIPYAMEECRKTGVVMAHRLTARYVAEHPASNITTNVDCQWERATT